MNKQANETIGVKTNTVNAPEGKRNEPAAAKARAIVQRFKTQILTFAALGGLMMAGTLMNASHAVGGPTTTIAGPFPLPVATVGTSKVAVEGVVAATQSGLWNVGITGTPSVTVANSPTVRLGNTTASPGIVLNAEKATRIPYQSVANASNCHDVTDCQFTFTSVPAGYRLVAENISGFVNLAPGTTVTPFGYLRDSSASGFWGFQRALDERHGTGITLCPSVGQVDLVGVVTLTGYLESCAVVGCPAVQH